jgi:hypothetical protein
VHFMVDMTEARTADGRAFDPAVDKVYLNGDFLNWSGCFTSGGLGNVGWARWEVCPGGWGGLPNLTKVPPNCVYSLSVGLSPPGGQVLAYRYSINGQDNEPTGGRDHVRWVRGTGEYSLPLDKFGAPVQEQSFGDLTATLSDPQQVLISWLGRPGVRLQSCANPATGPWQDHPETDGLSATNWPVAQASVFFRLAKR